MNFSKVQERLWAKTFEVNEIRFRPFTMYPFGILPLGGSISLVGLSPLNLSQGAPQGKPGPPKSPMVSSPVSFPLPSV